jgi:hypothetical protein
MDHRGHQEWPDPMESPAKMGALEKMDKMGGMPPCHRQQNIMHQLSMTFASIVPGERLGQLGHPGADRREE